MDAGDRRVHQECLTLEVDRSLTSTDVIGVLDRLIAEYGAPDFVRSDNEPEFVAKAIQKHLAGLDVDRRFIEPGAPWENGYIESFNGTLREDLLNREVFGHLLEARVLGEPYRTHYNTEPPHSSLDYRTPTEFAASHAASSALTTVPDEHSPWHENQGHLSRARRDLLCGYHPCSAT